MDRIKNTSNQSIVPQGWRIGDATGQSGRCPILLLQPDMFQQHQPAAGSAAAVNRRAYGATVSITSVPRLDNDGGHQIFLIATNGITVKHAVALVFWHATWYQNELKKKVDGRWK